MKKTIYITIIGFVGIIVCVYYFKESDKTLPNYATVIGTICSIVGLSIAYINILALKKESIIISNQINLTLEKVNQINSLTEISKAIKVNQEIQEFLRNGKIELARLRTMDLKYMLLHFNNDLQLNELTSDEEYKKLILDYGIDLNSLNDSLINPKRKVDYTKVVNNLEELSTYLTKFELKLKSIKI